MARSRRVGPPLAVAVVVMVLLLLPDPAAAQASLMSQASNLLLTMTSAINTYHELRNMTAKVIGGGRAKAKAMSSGATVPIFPRPAAPPAPTPITDEPFSVRVLKVEGIGGPTYDWKVATQAVTPNITISASNSTRVKFVTSYTRTRKDFKAYGVKGVVELRNNQLTPTQIDGPVKILLTMKRPVGITTGPEAINITHLANCGPATPVVVPPRRGKIAGTLLCTFEAQLPRSDALLASAEAALAALGASPSPEEEEGAAANATAPADQEGDAPAIDNAANTTDPYSAPAAPAAPVAPAVPGSSQTPALAPLPATAVDPWAPPAAAPAAEAGPAVPAAPVAPAAPETPATPVVAPTSSVAPATPGAQVAPATPPTQPAPAAPVPAFDPAMPLAVPPAPETPVLPVAPAVPAAPLLPTVPAVPAAPVLPSVPAVPAAPVLPTVPAVPAAPLQLPKSAIQPAPVGPSTSVPANPAPLAAAPAAPVAAPVAAPAAPVATPTAVAAPVSSTVQAVPATPAAPAIPAAPTTTPAPQLANVSTPAVQVPVTVLTVAANSTAAPAAPQAVPAVPTATPVAAPATPATPAVPAANLTVLTATDLLLDLGKIAVAPATPAANTTAPASDKTVAPTTGVPGNATAAPTRGVPANIAAAPAAGVSSNVTAAPAAGVSANIMAAPATIAPVAKATPETPAAKATPGASAPASQALAAQQPAASARPAAQVQPAVQQSTPAAPAATGNATVGLAAPAATGNATVALATPLAANASSGPASPAINNATASLEAGKRQVTPAPVAPNTTAALPDRIAAAPANAPVAAPSAGPAAPKPTLAAPAANGAAVPLVAVPAANISAPGQPAVPATNTTGVPQPVPTASPQAPSNVTAAPVSPVTKPSAPSSSAQATPAPTTAVAPVAAAPIAAPAAPAAPAAQPTSAAPISLAPLPALEDPNDAPQAPLPQAQTPSRRPPRRGRRGGVRAASLDIGPPPIPESQPGVVRVASLNAAANIAATQAEALVPDVSISVIARPLLPPTALDAKAALPGSGPPQATSPPYKAWFEAPEKACVVANEVLSGPLAKYLIPTGSSLPSGVRTICGPTATHSFDALIGNFDSSACGTNTLSNGAAALPGANAATVNVNVVGCKEARATISLSKLQTLRIYNQTWTARIAVLPVLDKTANQVVNTTLNIPAGGTAAAKFGLQLLKSPPPATPNYRLRGEVTIKTTSLLPEVMPATRLVITSTDGSVRNVPINCAPTVLLISARCTFDIPWPAAGTGSVQAQLKTMLARNFDTTSGTPKMFDFSTSEEQRPGNCIRVARTYLGRSAVNTTAGLAPERPFVSLVNGVDALLGAVNLNLSTYGLPASSVGQLFGLAGRRRLAQVAGDVGEVTVGGEGGEEATGGGEESTVPGPSEQQPPALELPLPPSQSSFETTVVTGRLRYVHPLQVLSGQAPPGPASRTPLQICKSTDLFWTEQFGHAPVEACGELYNALSTYILTPLGRGAQPAIKFNASLPVLVAKCDLKPQLKLLSIRTAALNTTVWGVTAKALDTSLKVTDPVNRPAVARFTVTYARTFKLDNYTIEAAAVLLNSFAKALPVRGVFATVITPDSRPITARLTCKGALNGTGELVLPAAPASGTPVPIVCIGSVRLPGPTAGSVTLTAATARGDVTSSPGVFDVTKGVDQIGPDQSTRCTNIDGNFVKADGEEVVGLTPSKVGITAPKHLARICESRRFTFNATFGPFGREFNACGHFMAHFVGTVPSAGASAKASTPISVSGCAAPLPTLAIATLRTTNITKRFTWSVERRVSLDGAAAPLSRFVSLDAGSPKVLQHVVTYRRGLSSQAAKEYRVSGTVTITNPSQSDTIGIDTVSVIVRRNGANGDDAAEVQIPVVCGASKRPMGVTLGPAAALRCAYDGAVSSGSPGSARVVANLHDGRTVSGSVAAAVNFAKAVAVAHGECALVSDDFTVLSAPSAVGADAAEREATALRYVGEKPPSTRAGAAAAKVCATKEYRMTWQLGPFEAGQCGRYTFGGSATARPLNSAQGPASSAGGKLLDVAVSGC